MYHAVKLGLQPLNHLSLLISKKTEDQLQPLTQEKSTTELQPLVEALNQLIARLKEQLLKERQFLDTCAHELRTPVTALVSQIQSVNFLDNKIKSQLKQVHLSALRTIRVANQFLTLAKSTNAEALALQNETLDLCELIRQLASDLVVEKNNLSLQLQSDQYVLVNADPLAMEIVIRNMIENALRYGANPNNEQSIVLISCKRQDHKVYLTIEDNGPGVDAYHRDKLLQRFYRIPGQNTEGAGLGLSIVTEVAKRYAGEVIIDESKKLGGFKLTVIFKNI